MIWRIGDGQRVNIWADPWVPNAAGQRPATPRGHTVINRVSDLIDPVTGGWDEVLVRDMFWEMDTKLILAIPVNTEQEDFLAWHYDGKGMFTVKSAYHVLNDVQASMASKQVGESSSGVAGNRLRWLDIWKQKCQPKVWHFLWRLAHNSLPLKRNIKRRGMDADTLCPMCRRLDEDGGHLFMRCKAVKPVWRSMNLEQLRCVLMEVKTGADVVRHVLGLKEETRQLVIHLLWSWWDARNKANAGERSKSTAEVVHLAQTMAIDVVLLRPRREVEGARPTCPVPDWRPPKEDVLKINFDGAFIKELQKGAWGFIIRDHHGSGVAAGTGALLNLHNAIHAEARACLEALKHASLLGISRVELETDSLNLQKALMTDEFDLSPGGWLFREARRLLLEDFVVEAICHCNRSCNTVAHELAQSSVSRDSDEPLIWFDPLPSFVQELLIRNDAGSMS